MAFEKICVFIVLVVPDPLLAAHPAHRAPLRRFFMFEVRVDIAVSGKMLSQARDHLLALFSSVSRFAVAIVGVVGGDHVGRVTFRSFSDAESDIAVARAFSRSRRRSGSGQPGFVAELKGGAHGSRQAKEKLGKHRLIRLEIRRKLKEQWSQSSGTLDPFQSAEKTLQKFVCILQAFDVRQNLVGFNGETKMLGRFGDPVLDSGLFHQLAEGVVDFDCIQSGRVEIQKFFLGELLRIESGLPSRISPSRGADVKVRHMAGIITCDA